MTEFGFFNLAVLPAGLGLLGFIEPCSIGSTGIVLVALGVWSVGFGLFIALEDWA